AFGDEYISVIAIIIMVQNFLVFSVGIWLLERKTDGGSCFLTGVLKVPTIYAIVAALALRLILRPYNLELPPQLMQPLNYLAGGLIPIALLTLGIQLGRTRMTSNLLPISVIAVLRLAVSPILAVLLVYIFRFEGTIASILIVAAGLPVAVNVFILSAQYKHDEQFASQAVFWTTLLSGVTISILLSFFA
ncbi:MAG: AEC family transporter, partial [Phycisphaerae bacterium]|nr:AEC family transporter [Phycisphaerae bacterium]